jgi:hypothetical protein
MSGEREGMREKGEREMEMRSYRGCGVFFILANWGTERVPMKKEKEEV